MLKRTAIPYGVYLALLFLVTASRAKAELISVDWKTEGDGLLTLDTETGLEWLDLAETQRYPSGLSFFDISFLLAPGEEFDGFRFAEPSEVDTLFSHASIPIPTGFNQFQIFDFEIGDAFVNLFGQTGLIGWPDGSRASAGIFAVGPITYSDQDILTVYRVQAGKLQTPAEFARVDLETTAGVFSTGGFGTFLVAAPEIVPEPSTSFLAVFGILGLLGFRCCR